MHGIEHLDRAIEHCGSQAALAERLGLWQTAISGWRARGRVPAEHCPSIERATDGLVTCEQLRDDVEWSVIRCPQKAA